MSADDEIIESLIGQNWTEVELSSKYDVTIEHIEELMVENGYERCEVCDYWFEMSETIDEDDEPTYCCESCRRESSA